jgi:hypothetical protein
LAAATTAATCASASTQPLGGALILCDSGIAQSSCAACRLDTCAPWRTAWRMRAANSGWSLRRNEPITNTRCSLDSDAIEVPSQCALPGAGRWLASACRSRVSMFRLPRPRTSLASRCSSSTVACGAPTAPMPSGPNSAITRFRPSAT